MEDHSFAFTDAPAFEITKAYRDDNGQMFVEGIASTVDIDLTGERMAPEALAKMAARAIGLPLRDEHGKGWHDRLGEIIKADLITDELGQPALWIKAKLFDWSSKARDLFGLLKSGAKMGLSVAGRVHSGGLVKELSESLGKYVPTYKDVDLTEVSITDHPANLGTFAVAVAKSLTGTPVQQSASTPARQKDDIKPSEYKDVATSDFLDPEHFKYPVDEAHLMPALRSFNQSGQRSTGGYEPEQWAVMGRKLARKLSAKVSDTYHYDPESETVMKPASQSSTAKEVNDMTDKGNLVSKQYNVGVQSFAKEWGHPVAVAKNDEPKTEEAPAPEAPAEAVVEPVGEAPAETPATPEAPVEPAAEGEAVIETAKSSTSSIASLLADIATSLSTASSSMSDSSSSSSDSSSSDSSDSSDSDSSTSTGTTTTSTDKAADDELMNSLQALAKAAKSFQTVAGKRGAKGPVSSTTSAPTSTNGPVSSTTTTPTATAKALDEIRELKTLILEMKKSQDEAPKARKGYAIAIEKQFQGHNDVQGGAVDANMIDTLTKDAEITYKELHMYKDYGIVPKKYAKAASN